MKRLIAVVALLFAATAAGQEPPAEFTQFGSVIMDEGVTTTRHGVVNFIGSPVTCVSNAGAARTDCTITGGGATPGSSGEILTSDGAGGQSAFSSLTFDDTGVCVALGTDVIICNDPGTDAVTITATRAGATFVISNDAAGGVNIEGSIFSNNNAVIPGRLDVLGSDAILPATSKIGELTIDDDGVSGGNTVTTIGSLTSELPSISGIYGDIAVHDGDSGTTGVYQYHGDTGLDRGWRKLVPAPFLYHELTKKLTTTPYPTSTWVAAALIDDAQASGIVNTVILVKPPHRHGKANSPANDIAITTALTNVCAAEDWPGLICVDLSTVVGNAYGNLKADGVHPTDVGYSVIAAAVAAAIP